MASPTEGEILLQLNYAILALEEARKLAEANATNILGIEDQLVLNLKGDFNPNVLGGWNAFRSRYSDLLSAGTARALIDPHILNIGKLISSPNTDPYMIFRDWYDWMVTNSKTVEQRDFTYGSPAAGGSNVGNGTVNRLNLDENGYDIDTQTADAKSVTCIKDEHSGAQEHAEIFEIRGANRTKDYLTLKGGSGVPGGRPIAQLAAIRPNTTYIANPSFT